MQNKMRISLLATTACALALMLGSPAHAADKAKTAAATAAAPVSKLQSQINELQKEIDALKVAQTAAPAPVAAEKGSVGEKLQSAVEKSTGVKLQLGGFFDMTGIYRTKNEGSDTGTNFNGLIPFKSQANAHQSEYRASARNTRISLLATGNPDQDTTISGYFETDFSGTGANSSSMQTSNYTPRLRQAFAQYDRADTGWHLLGGQAWSLATQNTKGITARQENGPIVLDSSLVPGFVYDRQAQFRVVKDLDQFHVGLSAEAPNANVANTAYRTTASLSGTDATNTGINGTGVSSTVESVPDIIAKATYDEGIGHYEVFGIGRTFHDHSTTFGSHSAFAANGGASVLLKTLEGKLDITANGIVGQGTGRYAAAQLPDYAVNARGGINPILSYAAMFGVVGHPTSTLDVFSYAGIESLIGRPVNYGEAANASLNSGDSTAALATGVGLTKRVWQVTAGGWQSLYKGSYGKFAVGLQESFTRKDAFRSTVDGYAPHANESVTLVSFRFTPAF